MSDEVQTYELSEVAAHNTREDLWMVIEGKVYDVTKFLDEHPGGEEVMIEQGGQDATEAFDEIGHSDDARDLLKTMYLGELAPSAGKKVAAKVASAAQSAKDTAKQNAGGSGSILFALVPVVVVVAFAVYKYLEKQHN